MAASIFLNLKTIRESDERIERRFEPSAFADEEFRVVAPASLAFDVHKDGERYQLEGAVDATLEFTCSRCLEGFRQPIHATFDLRYLPQAKNVGEGELEVQEDDLTTAFYQEDQIDLGQLMREQFYLAMPMKPLCSDACKGLCPQCGMNLNTGTCSCPRDWPDPRLDALRSVFKEKGRT